MRVINRLPYNQSWWCQLDRNCDQPSSTTTSVSQFKDGNISYKLKHCMATRSSVMLGFLHGYHEIRWPWPLIFRLKLTLSVVWSTGHTCTKFDWTFCVPEFFESADNYLLLVIGLSTHYRWSISLTYQRSVYYSNFTFVFTYLFTLVSDFLIFDRTVIAIARCGLLLQTE